MSKPLAYTITVVVCLLLQVAVGPAMAIGGCTPCFLLIPVLLISLNSGAAMGGTAGFLLGLFADFAGNSTVGSTALVFTLIALVAGLLGTGMDMNSALAVVILAVVASFAYELLYAIVSVLTSAEGGGAWSMLLTHSLPSAVYDLVIAVVALVTIRLVLVDDSPSMPSRLGGYGSSRSIFMK